MDVQNLGLEDWRVWRDLRLRALTEAPYAFGSTLAEWSGDGDTEERWRARLSSVPLNLVASLDDQAVGMVGAVWMDREVELISMWVAPQARGRGVGAALIDAVVGWAREQQAHRVTLDVREGNARAIGLYERHGFIDVGPAANSDATAPERKMVRLLGQG
ncbi:MAG: GNAT family N-acetyltransferase [Acidimicrobiales bacterium]